MWQKICSANGLKSIALHDVANWVFADATLERYRDEILCHYKVRQLGFHGWDDSEEAFFRNLQSYRDARILPA